MIIKSFEYDTMEVDVVEENGELFFNVYAQSDLEKEHDLYIYLDDNFIRQLKNHFNSTYRM